MVLTRFCARFASALARKKLLTTSSWYERCFCGVSGYTMIVCASTTFFASWLLTSSMSMTFPTPASLTEMVVLASGRISWSNTKLIPAARDTMSNTARSGASWNSSETLRCSAASSRAGGVAAICARSSAIAAQAPARSAGADSRSAPDAVSLRPRRAPRRPLWPPRRRVRRGARGPRRRRPAGALVAGIDACRSAIERFRGVEVAAAQRIVRLRDELVHGQRAGAEVVAAVAGIVGTRVRPRA